MILSNKDFPNSFSDRFIYAPLIINSYKVEHYTAIKFFGEFSVEHRVFPHITRALSGVILKSVKLAQELINKTSTTTGLKVFSRISKKIYETGRSIFDDFKSEVKIIHDQACRIARD